MGQHNIILGKGVVQASGWQHKCPTKSASKVDEEGVMVAVCRHRILLKGLNMIRGKIFAYPLYLQKRLALQNVQFFCSDVVTYKFVVGAMGGTKSRGSRNNDRGGG
ncbi:hypothetical protein CRENBAI_003935 [Crenichthys baileyi]|uniref:Uncharacterized protein n=1 Tax=Crenichthys baileyi TaxID=28760 RepID=A0AAV9SFR9_9TELE